MSLNNNSSQLRIVSDYVDFDKNKPDGIFININKKNIYKCHALIVGPKNTPYFGGFYLFEINFPKNYPLESPSLKMLTIDGKIRFNPNLYENGKVCLSILGTWAGPGWSRVMTLRTVLLSVQSLFSEFPIRNEPGLEEVDESNAKNINYNNFINFYNLKLGIINILHNILILENNNESTNIRKKSVNSKGKVKILKNKNNYIDKFLENNEIVIIKESLFFKEEILNQFKNNYEEINGNIKSLQIILGEIHFNRVVYFLPDKNHLDFILLNEHFDNLCEELKKMNIF